MRNRCNSSAEGCVSETLTVACPVYVPEAALGCKLTFEDPVPSPAARPAARPESLALLTTFPPLGLNVILLVPTAQVTVALVTFFVAVTVTGTVNE